MNPEADLLAVLRTRARGRKHAIRVDGLASLLGVSRREIQALSTGLVAKGILVGSSCSPPAGLFLIEDEDDLEEGTRHIRSRALTSLRRVSLVRRAAAERFGQETVQRLFDLDTSTQPGKKSDVLESEVERAS